MPCRPYTIQSYIGHLVNVMVIGYMEYWANAFGNPFGTFTIASFIVNNHWSRNHNKTVKQNNIKKKIEPEMQLWKNEKLDDDEISYKRNIKNPSAYPIHFRFKKND